MKFENVYVVSNVSQQWKVKKDLEMRAMNGWSVNNLCS